MTQQYFVALLAPKGVSISNAESIQPGGNSKDICKLLEVDPNTRRLIPHDEVDWQPPLDADVDGGVS